MTASAACAAAPGPRRRRPGSRRSGRRRDPGDLLLLRGQQAGHPARRALADQHDAGPARPRGARRPCSGCRRRRGDRPVAAHALQHRRGRARLALDRRVLRALGAAAEQDHRRQHAAQDARAGSGTAGQPGRAGPTTTSTTMHAHGRCRSRSAALGGWPCDRTWPEPPSRHLLRRRGPRLLSRAVDPAASSCARGLASPSDGRLRVARPPGVEASCRALISGRLAAARCLDGLLVEPPGPVRGAHQRPGHAPRRSRSAQRLVAQLDELLRLDPALDRVVPRRGAQVLGDRQQVAAGVVQVGAWPRRPRARSSPMPRIRLDLVTSPAARAWVITSSERS